MSTSPRSLSSSPDILGPPGDAQYLISSPIKPFTGRQSWMSPMIGKATSRTPAKRSRSRVSLSPAKSAHSIQFNDVILPGSPAMKFNGGRQRSISPEKLLQDGNVSPWRIRLTLEATQDEEENRGSPSRKRIKPSTVTTMIPLKDERSPLAEKTPRRRGRPRKSDMAVSPFPSLGAPGHTPRHDYAPGPGDTPGPGHKPGPRSQDSQPRKRGRPRGTPKPKEQDFELMEDQPTPTVEHTVPFSPMDIVPNSDIDSGRRFSPMDTIASDAGLEPRFSPMETTSHEAGFAQQNYSPMDTMNSDAHQDQRFSPTDSFAGSNAHASPIDLVADVDSEEDSWGNSEISIANIRDPTIPRTEDVEPIRREYGRTSLETPVIGATEHHFQDDQNIHSTPSKMPSPTRERAIQSSRSSRNTASPQSGTYPTPTPTSSLADEENQAQHHDGDQLHETDAQHTETDDIEEPADGHEAYEEYDTIMESEGFTMISLDTLPSAKQHGFGSSAMANGDTKPKEVGDRLKRKLPGTIEDLRNDSRARKSSSPVTASSASKSHDRAKTHNRDHLTAHTNGELAVNYVNGITYPELPLSTSPAKAPIPPKKRTFTSLAKLVRVALALQGPFKPQSYEWSGQNNMKHKRQRLEGVFNTFGSETRRELRMAIGLGQEIAMNRMIAEEEAAVALAAERAASHDEDEQQEIYQSGFDEASDEGSEEIEQGQVSEYETEEVPFEAVARNQKDRLHSPPPRPAVSMHQSPMSEIKRRQEAQWQLEREAVSRQAQLNSKSAIYIESDSEQGEPEEEEPDQLETERGYDGAELEAEEPEEPEETEEFEYETVPEPARYVDAALDPQPEPTEEEDDDFDDIWQLEANDHSYEQQSESENIQHDSPQPPKPLGSLKATPAAQQELSSSPDVPSERDYVARFGPSKVRELREQKVDLSALLAEEDTPNRARYYNGTSTPRSAVRAPLGARNSPPNDSTRKQPVSRTPAQVRLQPLSQSSPEVGSQHLSFHEWERSPQAEHESPTAEQPAEDYLARSPSAMISESEFAQMDSTSTPRLRTNEDAPGSTWFSKITSFTPQWLKAPARARSSSISTVPEEQSGSEDEEDEEEIAGIESARDVVEHLRDESIPREASQSPSSHWRQPSRSPQASRSPETQQYVHPTTEEEQPAYNERSSPEVESHEGSASERSVSQAPPEPEAAETVAHEDEVSGPRPLATFGYFSDDHYIALRRLYRIAKRHPEQFEYYDTPGRAAIIGDWIWTSDGHHGVPITEIQFAIIDRFAQGLSRADIQYGGSGQVDWTEADLHRRLISIVIGEQIREERKAKANRGTSVDTWR